MQINRRYFDFFIALVFLIMVVLLFFLWKESGQCLQDPFRYAAQEVTNENNNLMCSCSFSDQSYAPFSFNKEGIVRNTDPLSTRNIKP